jgi:hypothetical protein
MRVFLPGELVPEFAVPTQCLVGLYNSLEGIAQHYILPQITISLVLDPSVPLAA